MRHASRDSLEVSVIEVDAEPARRKGLESVISLYRQRWHQSPTVNVGRMPVGDLNS